MAEKTVIICDICKEEPQHITREWRLEIENEWGRQFSLGLGDLCQECTTRVLKPRITELIKELTGEELED